MTVALLFPLCSPNDRALPVKKNRLLYWTIHPMDAKQHHQNLLEVAADTMSFSTFMDLEPNIFTTGRN